MNTINAPCYLLYGPITNTIDKTAIGCVRCDTISKIEWSERGIITCLYINGIMVYATEDKISIETKQKILSQLLMKIRYSTENINLIEILKDI